jgi:hypothetical protein
MKQLLFWVAFVALLVLHHDFWFWDDGRLIFGFLPVGLGYQALISLAAAGLWAVAVLRVWPELFRDDVDEEAAG